MMADFRRAMMADFRRAVRAGHATKVDPMKAAEIRRAAVAALVTEAATGGADPVFALIEGHERVVGQKSALCARADEVDKTLPREQTTWTIRFNNEGEGRWPPQGCTDAPEWIDVQLAIGEITEKQCDLEFALLTTAPTTIEGAIALLAHLGAGEPPEERGMDGVVSLLSVAGVRYDERVRDAADAFPATLAAALRKIVAA
jgi:hypothetical protein